MSGGRLVVMDRGGRDVKQFPLAAGLATLGSGHACDIRLMLPTVSAHHATVVVHSAQAVVRNVGEGETLVNGHPISVAALCHADVITLGDRSLRWEYSDPGRRPQPGPQAALAVAKRGARGRGARRARRGSAGAGAAPTLRDRALQLALEMKHRASMPASASGKQVAIVQPQRRDHAQPADKTPARAQPQASKRRTKNDLDASISETDSDTVTQAKRKSTPKTVPQNTTKAALWIESRKSSPRRRTQTPTQVLNVTTSPRRKVQTPTQVLDVTTSPRTKVQTPTQVHSDRTSPRKKGQTPVQVLNATISPGKKVQTPSQVQNDRTSARKKVQTPTQVLTAKTSPRKKVQTPTQVLTLRRSVPAKKSTPLRLTVLKKAQSAKKARVIKIEAPLKIDHTKQAAIMLMTGHTPKSKTSPNQKAKTPSYVVKKPSPVRKTPRGKARQSGRRSQETGEVVGVTPTRGSTFEGEETRSRSTGNKSVTILEITDSTQNSTIRTSNISTRSGKSLQKSPLLPSPKKSALKDLSKKNTRKTESIKFDLSNLVSHQVATGDLSSTNMTQYDSEDSMTDDNLTLHYSESSNVSPSPRKSIHSRSSRILEKLGTSLNVTSPRNSTLDSPRATKSMRTSLNVTSPSTTLTPESPRARKSIRGSMIIQKALETSDLSDYTKVDDLSVNTTLASAFQTRTLSPRRTQNMESYSVVDLVSFDSDTSKLESNSSKSVYNSAGSTNTSDFGTPQNFTGRKTRSTINPTLLGSSTPYVGKTRATRSRSSSNVTQNKSTTSSVTTRRSKSLTTPDYKPISVNSTRLSRRSRSRSRINDSDLLLLDDTEVEDSSPKTSKRSRNTKSVTTDNTNVDITAASPEQQGISTPENRHSPVEVGTPVLSIQSLLDSSQSSLNSLTSAKKGRRSINYKRKTIGGLSEPKRRPDYKSKSLGTFVRQTLLRLSGDSGESNKTDEGAPKPDSDDTVTPKSAVKLVPEAVKNKHSTAKKPLSKRSIIDDLNQSDIVKQLFNSPVKRKLSQSMTEFSRKQLFNDDDEVQIRRPTRNTVALTGRTPENSILEQTEAITPERFVSPISTPGNSPNLSGIKRLFKNNTPENDLRNIRGVKSLLRTPRTRRSIKNDLTDVAGLKLVFAKSPKNRLSDVRVKEVFTAGPKDDLRRVSGVKSLFQKNKLPKNDLTDVRGVKRLFKQKSPYNNLSDVRGVKKLFKQKSPKNDLGNVSGVKWTLRNTTPKNNLSDVRGVKQMFRQKKQSLDNEVSGIGELFNESSHSTQTSEILFDQLIGKPPIKAVYSKTFSTKLNQKPKTRKAKSLHTSLDVITNNVEEWLEQELQKRLHKDGNTSTSKSKNATDRALQQLMTDTVEGNAPVCANRTRNSSGKKSASEIYSAHTLPIKKRSFVEVSLEKSKHQLPIKKRVVVHSTPVKGRVNMTMNASELGRVSPIAAVDKTREVEHNTSRARSTQIIVGELPEAQHTKAKAPRKQATPKKIDISKPVPPPAERSPPKRATRNKKKVDTNETNTKKRRASLVITKKQPVMSPKAEPKAQTSQSKSNVSKEVSATVSPKKTRATRGKKAEKVETPKRTRVRAAKATVVVAKPSPQLKPQAKGRVQKSPKKLQEKPTRGRRATAIDTKVESPKDSPKKRKTATIEEPKTRGKRTANEPQVDKPLPKRGRKTVEIEEPVQAKRGRKTNMLESIPQSKTRSRRTEAITDLMMEEKQPRRRGKKGETTVEPQPELSTSKGKELKGRGKKVVTPVKVQPEPLKVNESRRRGKKVESPKIVSPELTTRGRGRNTENVVEAKRPTRGKKVEPDTKTEETQPKAKTRGKKVEAETGAEDIQPKSRGKKVETQLSTQSERTTRGRRTKAADNTVIPETKSHKRKTTANEEMPTKIAKVNPKRGQKVQTDTVSKAKRTVAKGNTVENSPQAAKHEAASKTRGTRSKQVEEPVAKAKPTRGKKVAEPAARAPAAVRGKRRADVELSPAKASSAGAGAGRSRRR